MTQEVGRKYCVHKGCKRSFTPHRWSRRHMAHKYSLKKICKGESCEVFFISGSRWDDQRAQNLGWFMQRNGDVWCPNHVPDWVSAWRAKKNESKGE